MHNELRYHAKTKTHAISEKLSREKIKFRIFSPIFFFIIEKKKETEKQQEHAYGKGNNI
jgi:hypothetical protein